MFKGQTRSVWYLTEGRECRRTPGARLRAASEAGLQPERDSARSGRRVLSCKRASKFGPFLRRRFGASDSLSLINQCRP